MQEKEFKDTLAKLDAWLLTNEAIVEQIEPTAEELRRLEEELGRPLSDLKRMPRRGSNSTEDVWTEAFDAKELSDLAFE